MKGTGEMELEGRHFLLYSRGAMEEQAKAGLGAQYTRGLKAESKWTVTSEKVLLLESELENDHNNNCRLWAKERLKKG